MRLPPDWIGARLRLPGSAVHLAVVRIVFAAHAMTVLMSPAIPLLHRVTVQPLFATQTMLPPALEALVAPPARMQIIVGAGVIAAFATLVGFATFVALPLMFVSFFLSQNYFFRHSLFHDDWLYFNFFLLVLCFSPCADRLALDALLRRPRRERPANAYRWPVEVMILWFALIYVLAAVAKLFPLRKGLMWLSGGSAQHFAVHFVADSPIYWVLGRPLFDYGVRWPFAIAAILTVAIELSALLLVWTRRFDAWVVGAIIAMHVGITLFGVPGFVQIALVSAVLFLRPKP
jgi:hypothetical protein